jgi:hypothetical protein
MSNANQKASLSKSTKGVTPESGPIGGRAEHRRTGSAPTPANTGAKGKATTPKTY